MEAGFVVLLILGIGFTTTKTVCLFKLVQPFEESVNAYLTVIGLLVLLIIVSLISPYPYFGKLSIPEIVSLVHKNEVPVKLLVGV